MLICNTLENKPNLEFKALMYILVNFTCNLLPEPKNYLKQHMDTM